MADCSQSAISGRPHARAGSAGVRPNPGKSRYMRFSDRDAAAPDSGHKNASSSSISERWSTPMPCTNTTGNPSPSVTAYACG